MPVALDSEILRENSDFKLRKNPPVGREFFGTKASGLFLLQSNLVAEHLGQIREVFCDLFRGFIVALCIPPSVAFSTPLSHNEFQKLATQCASAVSSATLEAVARAESGLNPWVLYDNTAGQRYSPQTLRNAATMLKQWVARGDSIDTGLMQINSANLDALGITTTKTLDPCISLAGGAAILQAAYDGGDAPAEQQVALLLALSRYNTGNPFKGIMNGYTRTVMNDTGIAVSLKLAPEEVTIPQIDPSAPPAWNVSATGTYAQIHGASWLVSLVPSLVRNADSMTSKSRQP